MRWFLVQVTSADGWKAEGRVPAVSEQELLDWYNDVLNEKDVVKITELPDKRPTESGRLRSVSRPTQ